jgi:hypothetical protein
VYPLVPRPYDSSRYSTDGDPCSCHRGQHCGCLEKSGRADGRTDTQTSVTKRWIRAVTTTLCCGICSFEFWFRLAVSCAAWFRICKCCTCAFGVSRRRSSVLSGNVMQGLGLSGSACEETHVECECLSTDRQHSRLTNLSNSQQKMEQSR